MFDKLQEVEKRYEVVCKQLQDPDVINDQNKYKSLTKELSDIEDIVKTYRSLKDYQKQQQEAKNLLDEETDKDMLDLARQELSEAQQHIKASEDQLKVLLLPKDASDGKNVILEIRAGAGGDEASLFAEELFRAYGLLAANKKWKMDLLSVSHGNSGGYKEIIASVSGKNVYSILKFEIGVHRVQRVPKTESQGRVHTSTITVAVIPEADAVEVQIDPNDLKIDTYRSSGNGGQSVNTTDSAVRITHLPTNTVVTCQDGKSQLHNKETALKVLYSRLLAAEEERKRKEASDERLSQIGTGDRSERIRTYNFPQSRVTDHRIGLTSQRITDIMQGNFLIIIEPLITHFQSEALKQQDS